MTIFKKIKNLGLAVALAQSSVAQAAPKQLSEDQLIRNRAIAYDIESGSRYKEALLIRWAAEGKLRTRDGFDDASYLVNAPIDAKDVGLAVKTLLNVVKNAGPEQARPAAAAILDIGEPLAEIGTRATFNIPNQAEMQNYLDTMKPKDRELLTEILNVGKIPTFDGKNMSIAAETYLNAVQANGNANAVLKRVNEINDRLSKGKLSESEATTIRKDIAEMHKSLLQKMSDSATKPSLITQPEMELNEWKKQAKAYSTSIGLIGAAWKNAFPQDAATARAFEVVGNSTLQIVDVVQRLGKDPDMTQLLAFTNVFTAAIAVIGLIQAQQKQDPMLEMMQKNFAQVFEQLRNIKYDIRSMREEMAQQFAILQNYVLRAQYGQVALLNGVDGIADLVLQLGEDIRQSDREKYQAAVKDAERKCLKRYLGVSKPLRSASECVAQFEQYAAENSTSVAFAQTLNADPIFALRQLSIFKWRWILGKRDSLDLNFVNSAVQRYSGQQTSRTVPNLKTWHDGTVKLNSVFKEQASSKVPIAGLNEVKALAEDIEAAITNFNDGKVFSAIASQVRDLSSHFGDLYEQTYNSIFSHLQKMNGDDMDYAFLGGPIPACEAGQDRAPKIMETGGMRVRKADLANHYSVHIPASILNAYKLGRHLQNGYGQIDACYRVDFTEANGSEVNIGLQPEDSTPKFITIQLQLSVAYQNRGNSTSFDEILAQPVQRVHIGNIVYRTAYARYPMQIPLPAQTPNRLVKNPYVEIGGYDQESTNRGWGELIHVLSVTQKPDPNPAPVFMISGDGQLLARELEYANRLYFAKMIKSYIRTFDISTQKVTQRGNFSVKIPAVPGLDSNLNALEGMALQYDLALQTLSTVNFVNEVLGRRNEACNRGLEALSLRERLTDFKSFQFFANPMFSGWKLAHPKASVFNRLNRCKPNSSGVPVLTATRLELERNIRNSGK